MDIQPDRIACGIRGDSEGDKLADYVEKFLRAFRSEMRLRGREEKPVLADFGEDFACDSLTEALCIILPRFENQRVKTGLGDVEHFAMLPT